MKKQAASERVFTLLVGDRPILAFPAFSQKEAQQLPSEQWVKDDLSMLRSNGAPVWDGAAKITVRPANISETVIFHEKRDQALVDDGELLLAHLIELDD